VKGFPCPGLCPALFSSGVTNNTLTGKMSEIAKCQILSFKKSLFGRLSVLGAQKTP
jgi:hypothetical protein